MFGGQGVLEKGINWFDCYAICFDSTSNMISMKMNVDISLEMQSTCLRWTFHNLIVISLGIRGRTFISYTSEALWFHDSFFSFRKIIFRYFFSFRLGIHFRFDFYIENSPNNKSPIGLWRFEKLENKNLIPSSRWTDWSLKPESNLPHQTNIHYWPLPSRFACIYAKFRFHSLTYIQHTNKHTFRAISSIVE